MPLIMKSYGNDNTSAIKSELFLGSCFSGGTVRKLILGANVEKMSLICTPVTDYITLQSRWHRRAHCVSHYMDTSHCFTSPAMGITTDSTWSLATDTWNCGGVNFSRMFFLQIGVFPETFVDAVIISNSIYVSSRVPGAINKRPLN